MKQKYRLAIAFVPMAICTILVLALVIPSRIVSWPLHRIVDALARWVEGGK
jgi:hypothetical protein